MRTISNDRWPVRAAAALLLLVAGEAALASGMIEIDPRSENFASTAACEQALERRHQAALSRLAALPAKERRTGRVDTLKRNGPDLGYFELLDLSVDTPEIRMPRSQTESFTCRGSTLEHRIDYGSPGGR
jgi:hypothetical protein